MWGNTDEAEATLGGVKVAFTGANYAESAEWGSRCWFALCLGMELARAIVSRWGHVHRPHGNNALGLNSGD